MLILGSKSILEYKFIIAKMKSDSFLISLIGATIQYDGSKERRNFWKVKSSSTKSKCFACGK